MRDTEREREALLSEVGIRDDGGRSRRPAEVTFGEALRLPAKTILPMRWQPSSAWPLFPQLDADLEVASLGLLGPSCRSMPAIRPRSAGWAR